MKIQDSLFHVRLFSPFDKEVTAFRKRLYEQDLGLDSNLIFERFSYKECSERFSHTNFEEAYKFGNLKWEQTEFDGILGATWKDSNEIVSLSGFKRYRGFLRVGMHLYTLKSFRRQVRSVLWRPKGFIDSALELSPNATGCFISIYPHNIALKKWSERLSRDDGFAQLGQSCSFARQMMRKFRRLPGAYLFKNVPQVFFLMSLNNLISHKDLEQSLIDHLDLRPAQI